MLAVAVILVCTLILSASGQNKPNPLWNWPNSSLSYLPDPPPGSSSNAEYNGESSCGGGGDTHISFMCPHMMLLSPDMENAAAADGNDWAVYGVAGIGQTADCSKCYQLEITGGGSGGGWPAGRNKYIVQAVNTGGDVSSGQFDIFLGAGGFGIYDACSSDCQYGTVCSGGHCNAPQFGGNFYKWTPDGNCYGGGLRDPNECDAIVNWQENTFAEKTLVYGCKEALYQKYHQNFPISFKQVQCPKSLYQMTGIRQRNDERLLAAPHKDLELNDGQGRTTTMMDCCKPTCAWRQNVEEFTDPNWPQVLSCDKDGYPQVQ